MDCTTIPAAWLALYRELDEEVTWPARPVNTGTAPVGVFLGGFVKIGSLPKGLPEEAVLVVTDAELEQRTVANYGQLRQQEEYIVEVHVGTALKFRSQTQAIARLLELANAVVDRVLYTTVPGRHPAELAGNLLWWMPAGIRPRVSLLDHGGFGGVARVRIAVTARPVP